MLKAARPSSLQIILGSCVFVSLIAGAWAFHMLNVSQKFVKISLAEVALKGKTSSVDDCVSVTMEWYKTCEAMKSLCDSSVSRVMRQCLIGQDRQNDCVELGQLTMDTHFGFKECQARGVTRFTRKACANAFRAIDHHCTALKKGQL